MPARRCARLTPTRHGRRRPGGAPNDPQLDAWVARAQAGSPTLALAAARVREARSLTGVAQAALAPQVDGSLVIDRKQWPENRYYGPGTYNNVNTWNNAAALQLSYNLDLFGRDENAAERALDATHASAADGRAAQLELEANVVRAYIGLSQGFALRDIAQSTLEQQQKIAAWARRRLQGGIGTRETGAQQQTKNRNRNFFHRLNPKLSTAVAANQGGSKILNKG